MYIKKLFVLILLLYNIKFSNTAMNTQGVIETYFSNFLY